MGKQGRMPPRAAAGAAPLSAGAAPGFDLGQAIAAEFAADGLCIAIVYDKDNGRFRFRASDRKTGAWVRDYTSQQVIDRLAGLIADGAR